MNHIKSLYIIQKYFLVQEVVKEVQISLLYNVDIYTP